MKRVIMIGKYSPDPEFRINRVESYITEDQGVYILGKNLSVLQVRQVNGGLKNGGETYLDLDNRRLI